MTHHKLSLRSAILININIMLGAGLFINTAILAKKAGMGGALGYAIIGILMIPLIASIMQLLKIHPSGGFYTFASKELHPYIGFVSTWSYATGKLASVIIMIHSSMLFLQAVFPALASMSTMQLDVAILGLFIVLNMLDIKTNSHIQSVFFMLKIIPVFFGILVGVYLWMGAPQPTIGIDWSGIPSTLPLALFAIIGFEAACSLSSKIENAAHNAPRAVMMSYIAVICMNFFFQLMITGALGTMILSFANYTQVFPSLFALVAALPEDFSQALTTIMHLAIMCSALAGSYGIIFSNTWNWYTLAQHNHLISSHTFIKVNRFQIPWLCVIIQGIICLLYLDVTQASQLPLQQTAVLGVTVSYFLSIVSLIVAMRSNTKITIKKWIPLLALCNCLFLLGTIINSLVYDGADSLILFAILTTIGTLMFWSTPGQKAKLSI